MGLVVRESSLLGVNVFAIECSQVKGESMGSGSWSISTLINHFMIQSTQYNIWLRELADILAEYEI